MGTTTRSNKPSEWAAKVNHTHIINDPFIQAFIKNCEFPKASTEIEEVDKKIFTLYEEKLTNPIKHLLAVDGGYTTVEVKKKFPSSQLAFFQFGAVLFKVEDLEALSEKPFIFPEDMQKLHDLQRFKLVIPIKNILTKPLGTLKDSVRKAIYDFFMQKCGSSSFMETLKWFVFEEYKCAPNELYRLASHPDLGIGTGYVDLKRSELKTDFTFDNPNGLIYLTDVFRLHEAIDEEQGAAGILGYITRLIEQLIIVHFIGFIYKHSPNSLKEFLFIADGPLSFSGQTANMHFLMRNFCNYIQEKSTLYLVGIEKSGPFVEHAREICISPNGQPMLPLGSYLLLSNKYIYQYIVPGDSNKMHYGSTSYYGGKVIFHSSDGQVMVLTLPVKTKDIILCPEITHFPTLNVIALNMQKLRCSMYDDSIVPIALANKLVSLANHPSKILLEKFSIKAMGNAK